jgi:hypothetical protein
MRDKAVITGCGYDSPTGAWSSQAGTSPADTGQECIRVSARRWPATTWPTPHSVEIGRESLRQMMIAARGEDTAAGGDVHQWRPRRSCRGGLGRN